jgi:hypothetical protein
MTVMETTARSHRIAIDHDTQEMSCAFQPALQRIERETRGVHGVEHVMRAAAPVSNYNTNTYGGVSFMRVEPERIVADDQLQSKLESLCEALRSRY